MLHNFVWEDSESMIWGEDIFFCQSSMMNTHQDEMLYFTDSEIDPKSCWVGATHLPNSTTVQYSHPVAVQFLRTNGDQPMNRLFFNDVSLEHHRSKSCLPSC